MTNHTDTSRSGDLVERIEGCIANAEHDDEWKTLIDARDRIEALQAEVERLRGVLRYYTDKDDYGERARAALGEKQ